MLTIFTMQEHSPLPTKNKTPSWGLPQGKG
jgi:hypothetical protein